MLSELPPGDRSNIEEMCYSAPEPFRTVFFAYIDQVHITQGTINGSSMSIPGLGITLDTSATHLINIAAPNGTNNVPAWYLTFFHEIGHAIDYATKATSDPAFSAAISEDVRENLTQEAKKIHPAPSDADIQKAVDAIMKGKSIDIVNPNDPMWKQVQKKIQDKLVIDMSGQGGTYGWYPVGNVSDVYGGATNNALVGRNGNGQPMDTMTVTGMFGHQLRSL